MTTLSIALSGQSTIEDSLVKRHDQMMSIMLTKPKYPIKTIGIYVYDGFNSMDAMGPYHTLGELMGVQVFFVAKHKGMVYNQKRLGFEVKRSIEDVKQLDVLVIPGGSIETFLQTQDSVVLDWIKMIDQNSVYTTSVCTGGWILGATGLLKDKNVTTNWYRADEIMKMYGAHFMQQRYVQDGKYWTSAGVTAGMDMGLAIVKELMGDQYTQGVMLDLEYDPHPPIDAGSVTKTEPIVSEMMRTMYDGGLYTLIEKEKQKRNPKPKPTIWQEWPALDEFHNVMAATFHPSESGDLKPLKSRSSELMDKAIALNKSIVPIQFNKPEMKNTLALLEKESMALTSMVKNKKSDNVLTKSIASLHDRFHQIVVLCKE